MLHKDKKIVFLHFPKTAGWSMDPFLRSCGFTIVDPHVNGGHMGAFYFDETFHKFGFMRHPVDWYISMYNFLNGLNWEISNVLTGVTTPFNAAKRDSLDEFITASRKHEGMHFDLYMEYILFFAIGRPRECKMVFQMENMWDHLRMIMNSFNIKYDENYIQNNKDIKINHSQVKDTKISRKNLEYIFDSCNPIFKRFKYKKQNKYDTK